MPVDAAPTGCYRNPNRNFCFPSGPVKYEQRHRQPDQAGVIAGRSDFAGGTAAHGSVNDIMNLRYNGCAPAGRRRTGHCISDAPACPCEA